MQLETPPRRDTGAAPPAGRRRVTATALLHVLGDWHGQGPAYQRLAAGLRAAVERGDLPIGALLPAERVLARTLWVSRGTVATALDLLRDEGVLARRQGSGTWVARGADGGPVHELTAGVQARYLTRRFFQHDAGAIDLAISALSDCGPLPASCFDIDLARLARLVPGHGYHPAGLPALRERIARLYCERGVPTPAEQIVVTLGAQQAIALTARLLVRPGDVVAVEAPTFPGAIDVYSRAGARFASIGTDSGGARPSDAERVITRDSPRLVYLVPTAHNPTGTVLPDHRRADVARLADETGTWLVEDESLAWTTFERPVPPQPIVRWSRVANVLSLGSLSKVFWGGLRVGWIRAPEPAAARLGRLKAAQDLGNCAVSQVIALGLLDHLDDVSAVRRHVHVERAGVLSALLGARLPEWSFRAPAGGLSLWAQLPTGTGADFATVALRHGVGVLPGTAAAVDNTFPGHIRISFAEPPDRLHTAVDRLVTAWHAYRGHLHSGSSGFSGR